MQSIDEAEDVLDDRDKGRSKYVVDGMVLDILPRVVIEDNVDTWRERDGGMRALSKDERGALELLRKVMVDGKWEKAPNMRAVPRKKLMREVEMVDGLMHNVLRVGMDVTEVNRLLYAGGIVVARRLGLKFEEGKKAEQRKPFWQRRIEGSIETWRKDLSQVEEIRKGSRVGDKVRKGLERKYQVTERGAASVSTFLKGKIQAGSTKIR